MLRADRRWLCRAGWVSALRPKRCFTRASGLKAIKSIIDLIGVYPSCRRAYSLKLYYVISAIKVGQN